MFDLTQSLTAQRRQKAALYIKLAARMIAACPDEKRQWRAMSELRKLQAIAKGAA